jgi:hypothetical protein
MTESSGCARESGRTRESDRARCSKRPVDDGNGAGCVEEYRGRCLAIVDCLEVVRSVGHIEVKINTDRDKVMFLGYWKDHRYLLCKSQLPGRKLCNVVYQCNAVILKNIGLGMKRELRKRKRMATIETQNKENMIEK